ncbi:MAG TPA: choice-of-anchor tandem repeat GloVer-containing protein [Terriglobales bacterium]|jgi:uncharacterized repeat protein (TIGR03803 family)|nr:choice-of-anchor tandem repeat GloVer-containing protein [Terriglobales bacterium]
MNRLISWVIVLGCMTLQNGLAATQYNVLHAFAGGGNDGGGPFAALIFDQQGNLYSTTSGGGAYGLGTVFELSPSAGSRWIMTILHSFCPKSGCSDGSLPMMSLAMDPLGNLYGSSREAIFEISPHGDVWGFRILYNGGSASSLLLDKAGNLYGAFGRGTGHGGAISELIRGSNWRLKILYNFCPTIPCVDGESPNAVIWDSAGDLYGTTELGGKGTTGDFGTAFELRHANGEWKHRVLHSFPAFQGDGEVLFAGLISDDAGNLYGTTNSGGKYTCSNAGCGTVFRLSQDSQGRWKEMILYYFKPGKNGNGPGAGLAFDSAGNLYGTTATGGAGSCGVGCGVVFKLTPKGDGKWVYGVLHRFNGQDGANPAAAVILDREGNLYGTATQGGPNGFGVVFEITQ